MKNIVSLKNSREFGKVYNHRESFANKYLVMYLRPNSSDCSRIGISVSKKVGNSVVRHRITRLIRESYRLNKEKLKTGYDMVIVSRVAAKGRNYHEIESAFLHLAKRHRLLRDEYTVTEEPECDGQA